MRASCHCPFNSKQYRGWNCRATCFLTVELRSLSKNSCALLRRGAHLAQETASIGRKMKPEITGRIGRYLAGSDTPAFFESKKRERGGGRVHRAQKNPRRLRQDAIMMGRDIQTEHSDDDKPLSG